MKARPSHLHERWTSTILERMVFPARSGKAVKPVGEPIKTSRHSTHPRC